MKLLDAAIQWLVPPGLLIAQTTTLPDALAGNIYMELVRSLGVLVVLAWYLYYQTSVAMPRIMEIASQEREAIARLHMQELDQKRKDYSEQMDAQRAMLVSALVTSNETFRSTVEKIACKFRD
tara:strand:- start:447 stop:815 length:369 start_codon:yes stop_codon:yes gene_type:complete